MVELPTVEASDASVGDMFRMAELYRYKNTRTGHYWSNANSLVLDVIHSLESSAGKVV